MVTFRASRLVCEEISVIASVTLPISLAAAPSSIDLFGDPGRLPSSFDGDPARFLGVLSDFTDGRGHLLGRGGDVG